MMDFARPVIPTTTFANTSVEPFNQLRLTVDKGRVQHSVNGTRGARPSSPSPSASRASRHAAYPALRSGHRNPAPCVTVVRYVSSCSYVYWRACEGSCRRLRVFGLVELMFHIAGQTIVVGETTQFGVVGSSDLYIACVEQRGSVSGFAGVKVVPTSCPGQTAAPSPAERVQLHPIL